MSGKRKSALNISKGIDIPSSINKNAAKKYISRQHDYGTAEELYRQLKSGDRIARPQKQHEGSEWRALRD